MTTTQHMTTRLASTLLAALLAAACSDDGVGDGGDGEPHGPGSPEIAAIEWILGTWECDGTLVTDPAAAPVDFESDVAIARELGGHWYVIEHAQRASDRLPEPARGVVYWGFAPDAEAYLWLGFSDNGELQQFRSPGPEAEGALVWDGEMSLGGPPVPVRVTFERDGDDGLDSRWEADLGGGQWGQFSEERCVRLNADGGPASSIAGRLIHGAEPDLEP